MMGHTFRYDVIAVGLLTRLQAAASLSRKGEGEASHV
jgi:hypothetical protein